MVLSGDRIVFFRYGTKETEYLKARDARLGSLIERIGHIDRETDPDLFSSVIRHIIGQQISSKAQKTIWNRMLDSFGSVTPDVIAAAGIPRLQSFGMTFRKADYIAGFASDVLRGKVDLGTIERMTDEDAIRTLTGIRGIGTWTAEMILLFSLGRPDILFRRSRDSAGTPHGLSPQSDHAGALSEVPAPFQPVRQCREPLPLGRRGGRGS